MQNIAIYGRNLEANKSAHVQQLFDYLAAKKNTTWVYEPFFHYLKNAVNTGSSIKLFNTGNEIKDTTQLLISLGGDGTLLETLDLIRDSGTPVLGINTGRLGFLASVSKEEVQLAVDAIVSKKYVIDTRSMLMIEKPAAIFGDVNYALNDITIGKSDTSAMIIIHTYFNEQLINSYYADGLIISSPTGSTAYSLSCGGPIVLPDSENFIITPIAPHNLNVRPLVIPDSGTIKIKVEGRNTKFMLSLDSRSKLLENTNEIIIKKSPFGMNIVKLENHEFLTTLRNKLMWGIDKRN
jgi:NAD+ kinase